MNRRGKVLTNDNINILLEQIDNGNTSEFEGSEEEEDFDMVNNIINDNEDIDQLLLENDEYFKQLENSNLNFGYVTSVDASQINTSNNSNNNLNPNVQQIKYINTMKWLRTNRFKPKKKLIRYSPEKYNDAERHD
ncbi:hypothetical protein QTP88_020997 [Uroleucon formosanum]